MPFKDSQAIVILVCLLGSFWDTLVEKEQRLVSANSWGFGNSSAVILFVVLVSFVVLL